MTSIFEQHIISSGRHYSYFAGRDNEHKMKPTNHVRWGVGWNSPQGMASPMLPTWVSWLSVLNGHNLSSLFKVGIIGLDRHCSDWRSSRMAFELVPWSRKHSQESITDQPQSVGKTVSNLSWTSFRTNHKTPIAQTHGLQAAGPLHLLMWCTMYNIMRRCESQRLERTSTPALAWLLFQQTTSFAIIWFRQSMWGSLYTLRLN